MRTICTERPVKEWEPGMRVWIVDPRSRYARIQDVALTDGYATVKLALTDAEGNELGITTTMGGKDDAKIRVLTPLPVYENDNSYSAAQIERARETIDHPGTGRRRPGRPTTLLP